MAGQSGETKKTKWYRRTDPFVRGPLIAFLPFATLFLCQLVTLQSIPGAWVWFMDHPGASVVTYLALLFALLLVERLSTSLFLAGLVTMAPCLVLAIASYLKLTANGVPLLLSDLTMIGQAAEITGFLSPEMGLGAGTIQAVLIALVLLVLAFFWTRPIHKLLWWKRLLTAAAMGGALAITLLFPATGAMLDEAAAGANQATRNERLGVLAGMYAAARQNAMTEPGEYNEDNMNRIVLQISANAPRVATPEVRPNVILLMSESFFDPTRLPNVTYSTDPVSNFHELGRTFPSGSFQSNTYAGGTGNVEMEVLTGVSSHFLEEDEVLTTISAEGAYERIPSIVKAFANQGYRTTYVHSHTNALYSRTDHLPALGFETVVFRDDFKTEIVNEGYYASDDCWADEIIARFEDKGEDPIFLYGLSMENHQPYAGNKFAEPSPVEVTTDLLEGEHLGMFDSLIHGLYDADQSLGKLVDYFASVDEPTILVFFGDHLPRPSFGDGDTLYDRLGYSTSADTLTWSPEELKYMLSTDYLVWYNYNVDFEVPQDLSATGLGTQLLSWTKLPKPLYFTWIDTVMENMLMYRDRLFVAADGTPSHEIPEEFSGIMKRYETIVYDILYGESYCTEAMTGSKVRKSVKESMPEVITPPPSEEEEPFETGASDPSPQVTSTPAPSPAVRPESYLEPEESGSPAPSPSAPSAQEDQLV